jgi:hypothetical protein
MDYWNSDPHPLVESSPQQGRGFVTAKGAGLAHVFSKRFDGQRFRQDRITEQQMEEAQDHRSPFQRKSLRICDRVFLGTHDFESGGKQTPNSKQADTR